MKRQKLDEARTTELKMQLTHLLIKGEFRVWCAPNKVPSKYAITTLPSKCTCANCLTAFRSKTKKFYRPFPVKATYREGHEYAQKVHRAFLATKDSDTML